VAPSIPLVPLTPSPAQNGASHRGKHDRVHGSRDPSVDLFVAAEEVTSARRATVQVRVLWRGECFSQRGTAFGMA
jgi:hypothetical protein